jgi:hypothetical protein
MTDTQIHEARKIRDAEKADPGVIKRTLTEAVESGQEPTRAKVKKAISLPSWKKNLLKKARSLQPEPPRGRKAINRCTRAMSSFVLAVMREIDTSEHADLFAALRDELDDLESISKRNHEAAR